MILSLLLSQALLASTVNLPTIPIISPVAETTIHNPVEKADADDPAIYINAEDPASSLTIATFKRGGLGVYDLTGKEIQTITPPKIRYNNVDIAYGVKSPSQMVGETNLVDLAIASDRKNDTLAIFSINPHGYELGTNKRSILQNVTSIDIPTSIFGVDDGEATAYGLAVYTSVAEDKTYVFVSQSDGNKIAQLELKPEIGGADRFTVNAEIVRILEIPIPPGLEIEDAFVEGMVVDKETGMLYLAQENFGIWKVDAEPNSDRKLILVDRVKDYREDSPLSADVEGLSIYYGKDNNGYLIVSSQGDSTFAIYDKGDRDCYLSSFSVEGVENTDGLDVSNISFGEKYPAGLLVVQNGIDKKNTSFNLISMADIIDVVINNQ